MDEIIKKEDCPNFIDVENREKKKRVLKETPWGMMTYLDYKKKIELNKKQYDEIDRYFKMYK